MHFATLPCFLAKEQLLTGSSLELIAKLEHYLSREQYLLYVLRWLLAPVRLLPDLLGDTLSSWFPEFKL